jgi:ATP-dependent DNA ligase
MLCRLQEAIPQGTFAYEPKWDGFRCIVFRDGHEVHLESRKGQPLQRYFPELLEPIRAALPSQAVVDGEIVIAGDRGLEFETLQMRIHPAASRVTMLSEKTPATLILFDALCVDGEDIRALPVEERRRRLVDAVVTGPTVAMTPQTLDPDEAASWFEKYEGAGCDGVIAKPLGSAYKSGDRGWVKIKHLRTVDCVVGGYRRDLKEAAIASLLLGLYDGEGRLHHVGHTSSFSLAQRRELLTMLTPLEGGTSFGFSEGARAPGGPSRWTRNRDASWTSVRPELVCEVAFDHLQGDRFRHASRFLRWRSDKAPEQCTYEQLLPPHPFDLNDIVDIGT